MCRKAGTGTVSGMIGHARRLLAGLAVMVAPAASTLLCAPAAIRPVEPVATGPLDERYLASRAAMVAAGAPYRDWAGQFLVFDPRGDGRVAQVFGDLATADRIAVLVPGAGNRADNFERGVGDKRYRSPAVQADGLYEAAHAERFAVVAWLGYDAPDGLDRSASLES